MPEVYKRNIFRYLPIVLVWFFVSVVSLLIYYDNRVRVTPQLISTFLGTILCVPLSWYAARKMVPKYLYQKKMLSFIWRITYLIIINVILIYIIIGSIYKAFTGVPLMRPVLTMFVLLFVQLFVNLIFISIACGTKIIYDRFILEDRMGIIEKEKVTAELDFLRSQINPHFLFNILNTIYFQIDKTNLKARGSVESFSEMLRYQLYDCNTDKIEIKKEIDYIKSYVAMQRQRKEEGTDIQLHVSEGLEGFAIAPFMILTLVENAFKHISHFKNAVENKILINILKNEEMLIIKVVNTFEKAKKLNTCSSRVAWGCKI